MLLLLGEIKHLFVYIPVIEYVVMFKTLVIVNAEFVIEIAASKIQIKIRLIEVKNTVVISGIESCGRVMNTKCAVPECRLQLFLKRATGDDRDLGVLG